MKRLFTIFATFAMLCAVGCEEQGGDDVNPNDKPGIEQPDEKPNEDGNGDSEIANLPPANEIWYTSTDGLVVTPYFEVNWDGDSVFGANIVSNTYEDGKGVIAFDGDVTHIGYWAFYECATLASIIIPNGVTSIGANVFYNCNSLKSFTLPNSVTSIGSGAFSSCLSLTNAIIPDSVTEIGGWVLAGCLNLSEIKCRFASDNGRCLIIDGTLNSFAPAGLTEYNIPDGVTSVGETVFVHCSDLTSVTIPDSVTSIENSAFAGCSSLTSVTIPDSVTSIENSAFAYCSSLTSLIIPKSVTSIGASAFYGCTGTLVIDSKILEPDYSYEDYPSFSYSIYSGWLYGAKFSTIVIGKNVTKLGTNVLRDCVSLVSIVIPDSVTSIGVAAFYECSSLTSITISESVTSIGAHAFDYCTSLTEVYCKAITPPNGVEYYGSWSAFDNNASERNIYVPSESVDAYKAAKYWSEYAGYIIGYDFE